ncbi:unnamed protein product [Prorocentrum cordatum]|uniref:Uncharacterized protein n=1 Tax=Prorocentrum cordatum TaxID=2364126 RepID=A0ABN9TBY6_9DINO|nr:unnamed protein product [Polarella glacialis]
MLASLSPGGGGCSWRCAGCSRPSACRWRSRGDARGAQGRAAARGGDGVLSIVGLATAFTVTPVVSMLVRVLTEFLVPLIVGPPVELVRVLLVHLQRLRRSGELAVTSAVIV